MIDLLTPESVASEIRLLREDAGFKGAFLIVEGETDANFFSSFLAKKDIIIRWLKGKPKTIKLAQLLEKINCEGFVAIVDADFWYIDGVPSLGSNILMTDVHDLDMMIFSSPAFDKVMREYISVKQLDTLQKKFGDLRSAFMESVRILGYLRWISEKQGLGINFHRPDGQRSPIYWVDQFIVNELRFDLDPVLTSLCNTNRPLREHLRNHIAQNNVNNYNILMLCNGHDVMQVTCKIIRDHGRNVVRGKIEPDDIERSFRLAYEMGFFEKTNLYANLIQWQNSTGYKVLG